MNVIFAYINLFYWAIIMNESTININGSGGNEIKPDEIFKRMVLKDKEQNKRLGALSRSDESSSFNRRDGNKTEKQTIVRYFICVLGLLSLTTSQMSRIVLNQSITVMIDESMLETTGVSKDGSCPAPAETISPTNLTTSSTTTTSIPSTTTPIPTTTILTTMSSTTVTEVLTDEPCTADSRAETVSTFNWQDLTTVTEEASQTNTSPEISTQGEWEQSDYADKGAEPEATVGDINQQEVKRKVVEGERFSWDNNRRSTLLGSFYYGYFVFMIPGKLSR